MVEDMYNKYAGNIPSFMDQAQVARTFLAITDWMIVRELETGTPCPQEVKDARALARTQIP